MSASPRQSWFARLLSSRPPSAALAIDARRVTAVSVADPVGKTVVSGHATQALPPGAVTPALNAVNIHDGQAAAAAIKAALDSLTPRPRQVALVLPDAVAKVSLVRFDKVPTKATELEQLIRWQVRKAAPFKIEEAQVAWTPGVAAGAGREFVVTVARRDIIASYERACAAAGAHAGVVDVAALNLVNAVLAAGQTGEAGDWLLLNITPEDGTLAVVRGTDVVFHRHRAAATDDELIALVHQTAMYQEDRLGGGGFSRVVLSGASSRGADTAERLRRLIDERLRTRVEPLDFRDAVAIRDRISVGPDLLETLAAPLGLLVRERIA